ncbi:MAG: SsrA-binding protein SmpB [Acidimicrobiia bacterium]
MPRASDKIAVTNRRARHEYHILDVFECGLVLKGSEVKSIRDGRANLSDAFARVERGEVWLHSMHVSPYPFSRDNPDPLRRRKLLLHRAEIVRLTTKAAEKGLTLVPLKIYFQDGFAKVELAVGQGKRQWDKRQAMAERDARRETDRAVKERQR